MFISPVMRRAAYAQSLRGLDQSLERWLGQAAQTPATAQTCKAAVTQDENSTTLSFDMPGVTKQQLSIGIEGQVVRIESLPDAPRRYQLAYELPQDIDAATSEAKLELGVLTLKLGKRVAASKVTPLNIL